MLCLITLLTVLVTVIESCQEIRVVAEDGGVVLGRSMEFSFRFDDYLVTQPVGTTHEVSLLPNCPERFTFKNKHNVIVKKSLHQKSWIKTTSDGINDAGLSASMLLFLGYAKYLREYEIKGAACDNAIPHTHIVAYVLATYETVGQVKSDLESGKFPKVWGRREFNAVTPVHFSIFDKTGAGLVLEFVKGQGVTWYDNTVGVVTNSPPYPWHLDNLRNYPHFQRTDKGREGFEYSFQGEKHQLNPQWTGSGMLGMPGDFTSPSRFVRAATLLSLSGTPKTTDDAIVQVFHLMNAADIPNGVVETSRERMLYTWGITVKDLTRGCVYYRGYVDLSVKRVCFAGMPPSSIAAVKIEGKFQDGFRDTTGELEVIESTVQNEGKTEL